MFIRFIVTTICRMMGPLPWIGTWGFVFLVAAGGGSTAIVPIGFGLLVLVPYLILKLYRRLEAEGQEDRRRLKATYTASFYTIRPVAHNWLEVSSAFNPYLGEISQWKCEACGRMIESTAASRHSNPDCFHPRPSAVTIRVSPSAMRSSASATRNGTSAVRINDHLEEIRHSISEWRNGIIPDDYLDLLRDYFWGQYIVALYTFGILIIIFQSLQSNIVVMAFQVLLVLLGFWKAIFLFIDRNSVNQEETFVHSGCSIMFGIAVFVFALGIVTNGAVTIPLTLIVIAPAALVFMVLSYRNSRRERRHFEDAARSKE